MTDFSQRTTSDLSTRDNTSSDASDASDASAKDKALHAKGKALDTAQAGKQAAGEVAQTANDAAKDVAAETNKQARELLGKSKQQVSEQAGVQQSALVDGLRSLADQLTEMTSNVSAQSEGGAAVEIAAKARDRANDAAQWLDGREPADVLEELRDLGRRRPGVFLLGSVAAGVVAGRLTRGVVAAHSDDTVGSTDATSNGDRHSLDSSAPNRSFPNAHVGEPGRRGVGTGVTG